MDDIVISLVQCIGCPIMDKLFLIISALAARVYDAMVTWAWLILVIFWVFYLFWIVLKTISDKEAKDWMYQKSVKPVFINSLIICAFLGLGTYFPRFISLITIEPVTATLLSYSQAIIQTDQKKVDQKVFYRPTPMKDDGFFRPKLRDNIINIFKTTVMQFQTIIKLGFIVLEKAFSWEVLLAAVLPIISGFFIGPLSILVAIITSIVFWKQILMFVLGLYILIRFVMIFFKFMFRFVDIIVSLMLFAFFFPFMLVFFVLKNSSSADWVKKMGAALSPKLIKNAIDSLVGLVFYVVTFTIIATVIAKFLASDAVPSSEILKHILDGTLNKDILGDIEFTNITLFSLIVLSFIIDFLMKEIPKGMNDIYKELGISSKSELSDTTADVVMASTKNIVKGVGKSIAAATGNDNNNSKKN